LFSVKRGHPSAHRYQVTCLTWYPVDTGLFVSGSADQDVKVVIQLELQRPLLPTDVDMDHVCNQRVGIKAWLKRQAAGWSLF